MVKQVDWSKHEANPWYALFLRWCLKTASDPTVRQFNKFCRGEGKAYDAMIRQSGHDRKLAKEIADVRERIAVARDRQTGTDGGVAITAISGGLS